LIRVGLRVSDSRRASARLGLLRLAARALSAAIDKPRPSPGRVLLLRPDHVGDVLLTAPAVTLMRASLPAAQLTYVVGPWSLEAARHGPAVDSLWALAYPGFSRRRNTNLLAPYVLLAREAARLRRERFDVAVVLRPDHWWGALLAMAAGIPIRVGSDTPETSPLLTHTQPVAATKHALEQSLDLARLALDAFGVEPAPLQSVQSFTISGEAQRAADEFWKRQALDGQRVVAIQPNAGAPLKSWPVERWTRLADGLVDRGCAVLLVGAPTDLRLIRQIQARITIGRTAVACGQSLDVSAALYRRCALLVGPDSGAAHLAAAVGTPTVRLYGPAPVEVFGPWPPRADQQVLLGPGLACVPCGHLESPPCGATTLPACLLALGVEDVLKAVKAQLDQG
jgi:ADP-heptose:LPS heptosyltransferase